MAFLAGPPGQADAANGRTSAAAEPKPWREGGLLDEVVTSVSKGHGMPASIDDQPIHSADGPVCGVHDLIPPYGHTADRGAVVHNGHRAVPPEVQPQDQDVGLLLPPGSRERREESTVVLPLVAARIPHGGGQVDVVALALQATEGHQPAFPWWCSAPGTV